MLIIHHWDTDGICSAAKLVRILDNDKYDNLSPLIGDFEFDKRIDDALPKYDEIFVLDLNLPHIMEKMERNMIFIDHHHQPLIKNRKVTQINPLLEGRSAEEYPSATTVISDHYNSWDILSVLGAVGDIGDKAFSHHKVQLTMETAGIVKEDINRLVALIDSNYIAMDQDGVEKAVEQVLNEEPIDLLEFRKWNDNIGSIERTIDNALDSIEEINGFAYIDFDSPYNIISKVARKATWEMSYPGSLVINRGFNGKAQTYLRVNDETSNRMDIPGLIDDLKEMGVNAGGKKVVMGSIHSPELIDVVITRVKETMGI